MAKTDWKAEAKALKKKVRKLKDSLGAAAAPMAEAVSEAVGDVVAAAKKALKPVSPLAPASFPALPAIKGAEFAAVEAGRALSEPQGRDARPSGTRHNNGWGFHPLLHTLRLRSRLPGKAGDEGARWCWCGNRRELRQLQRLHRKGGG
jgi:chorismate synthase